MILNKHKISGKKGRTVCYTIPGFRFDKSDNKLKWDAFRFYTPEGGNVDEDGFNYFDVSANELQVERDENLDKYMMISITKDNGVKVIEVFEGTQQDERNDRGERGGVSTGIEGDIVASGFVPSSPELQIFIDFKEVVNS